MTNLRAIITLVADRDWPVFPCKPHDKIPATQHGFKDATTDRIQIRKWFANGAQLNVAIPTGEPSGVWVLDIDKNHGGIESLKRLITKYGALPETLRQTTPSGGGHHFFRWPATDEIRNKVSLHDYPGIDVRGKGGYVLVPPSRNGKGRYRWQQTDVEIAEAPIWLVDLIKTHHQPDSNTGPVIYAEGERNTALTSLAGTMRHRGMTEKAIEAGLLETNRTQCIPPLSKEEVRQIARSVARYEPAVSAVSPDLLNYAQNDHGNSQRLKAVHGNELRYVHEFKKWIVWNGKHWSVDRTEQAKLRTKLVQVEFFRQAANSGKDSVEKFARQSLDEKRINAALSMTQSELPITTDELDRDPYLLNFQNGIVDLRTGQLLPHKPEHFITKIVRHKYNPQATCPLFTAFVRRIIGNEKSPERAERLVDYLQLAFGYSLTGDTSEKVVFLLHGPGNNGKTTLLTIIRTLISEYSAMIGIETLMSRAHESANAQADLADLRGARFVMTSETEEGQRIAEGKLKRITQGMGLIKTCRKYENPITFTETHKLWMDANHKPEIRGTDNAIWNRLRLIPFTVTIPKEEQDRELGAKLKSEAEGILAWAVAGAIRWKRSGLTKPKEVADAVEGWRKESDTVGEFLRETGIERKAGGTMVPKEKVYDDYKHWCERSGEKTLSAKALTQRMIAKGFKDKRKSEGMFWLDMEIS